jgi:hypothetical protein
MTAFERDLFSVESNTLPEIVVCAVAITIQPMVKRVSSSNFLMWLVIITIKTDVIFE